MACNIDVWRTLELKLMPNHSLSGVKKTPCDFEFPERMDELLSCIDFTTANPSCLDIEFSTDDLFDLLAD
uniref:Uncharacterized protein n=1 Tax=Oryza punctata TaxID=4537 RepID=A0A0E0LJ82_ORYPU